MSDEISETPPKWRPAADVAMLGGGVFLSLLGWIVAVGEPPQSGGGLVASASRAVACVKPWAWPMIWGTILTGVYAIRLHRERVTGWERERRLRAEIERDPAYRTAKRLLRETYVCSNGSEITSGALFLHFGNCFAHPYFAGEMQARLGELASVSALPQREVWAMMNRLIDPLLGARAIRLIPSRGIGGMGPSYRMGRNGAAILDALADLQRPQGKILQSGPGMPHA